MLTENLKVLIIRVFSLNAALVNHELKGPETVSVERRILCLIHLKDECSNSSTLIQLHLSCKAIRERKHSIFSRQDEGIMKNGRLNTSDILLVTQPLHVHKVTKQPTRTEVIGERLSPPFYFSKSTAGRPNPESTLTGQLSPQRCKDLKELKKQKIKCSTLSIHFLL